MTPVQSVVEAARIRIRPILMTTAPLIVGLLPLALNLEPGGEMLQPMAAGAIGGLFMEVLVALILLPLLFIAFTKRGRRANQRINNLIVSK